MSKFSSSSSSSSSSSATPSRLRLFIASPSPSPSPSPCQSPRKHALSPPSSSSSSQSALDNSNNNSMAARPAWSWSQSWSLSRSSNSTLINKPTNAIANFDSNSSTSYTIADLPSVMKCLVAASFNDNVQLEVIAKVRSATASDTNTNTNTNSNSNSNTISPRLSPPGYAPALEVSRDMVITGSNAICQYIYGISERDATRMKFHSIEKKRQIDRWMEWDYTQFSPRVAKTCSHLRSDVDVDANADADAVDKSNSSLQEALNELESHFVQQQAKKKLRDEPESGRGKAKQLCIVNSNIDDGSTPIAMSMADAAVGCTAYIVKEKLGKELKAKPYENMPLSAQWVDSLIESHGEKFETCLRQAEQAVEAVKKDIDELHTEQQHELGEGSNGSGSGSGTDRRELSAVTMKIPGEELLKDPYHSGSLAQLLHAVFLRTFLQVFPALSPPTKCVEQSEKGEHDYQSNIALRYWKQIPGQFSSPVECAKALQSVLKSPNGIVLFPEQGEIASEDLLSDIQVSKQGFLYIYLHPTIVSQRLMNIVRQDGPLRPSVERRKVGVDFSSPNIAKEMHVGHLRSTIIGDAICRILEYLGHDVKRINHVGDWGTQFGMLLCFLDEQQKEQGVASLSDLSIGDLTVFYKAAKERFDQDEDFNQRAHEMVVQLQRGDKDAVKRWEILVEISKKMFDQVYSRLGVEFPDGIKGESFYNPRIPKMLEELSEKKVIHKDEETGALMLYTGAKEVQRRDKDSKELKENPLILRKKDGGYGYDSTDMAAIQYRLQDEGLNWLIYVTDGGQETHFQSIFAAARKSGWVDSEVRLDHVKFGVVQSPDGTKFKTRSGQTEKLVDLLDGAFNRMKDELERRVREESSTTTLTMESVDRVASAMGYAAIRYADLKNNRTSDYVFDYDQMLSPVGDTSVYLQYSFARTCSIFRKVELNTRETDTSSGTTVSSILNEGREITLSRDHPEWDLAVKIAQFPEVVISASDQLMPSIICKYAYHLSKDTSKFLQKHRLLMSTNQGETHYLDPELGKSRLLILRALVLTLRDSFNMVGITPLQQI